MQQFIADHVTLSNELMLQERREKEEKEKAAATKENPEAPESKKENPESKENSERKEEKPDGKADSSEAKAEGEKEAAIDLRPLTMEDLKQAKNGTISLDLHNMHVRYNCTIVQCKTSSRKASSYC